MPKPDEQPDQEYKTSGFNPVKIEASQTRLITTAVGKLEIDPEEKDKVGSPEADVKSGDGGGSHTIELGPGTNDSDDDKQRVYDKKQDEAFYNKHANPESFFEHL